MPNPLRAEERAAPDMAQHLARPRIDALLRGALALPLTTVVAGPGWGKTHAVLSAVAPAEQRVSWMQLSEMDNNVAILWRRFVHALAAHDAALAERLGALGFPDAPATLFRVLQLIEGAHRQGGHHVLILDDFHTIRDGATLAFFGRLIAAALPGLSIVIISRERPRLALAGMLARGQLARVTEDDLRFTSGEMAAYYRLQGLAPDADSLAGLYAYTEGWALAIYLTGLSLRRGDARGQGPLREARVDIFDLIEEEVCRGLSQPLRVYLAAIALLDILPAALLRALAAGAPGLYDEMAAMGVMIRYDAQAGRFRMHRLFREFLLERGTALPEAARHGLHLTAARWYEQNGWPEEAIGQYLRCGHYRELFALLSAPRAHVPRETAAAFIGLIDGAPAALVEQTPLIRVVRAKFLFNNNRVKEAQAALEDIRAEYEALPPTPARRAVLGEAYILLALISMYRQTDDFAALFRQADACLPDGSVLIDRRFNIAEGMNMVGIKSPEPGALARRQATMREAAPHASRVMNGCGRGMAALCATDAAFMTADLHATERHAHDTICRARQEGQHGIEHVANLYLLRLHVYRGDHAKATSLLQEMKRRIERLQDVGCRTIYDIVEGWYHVKIGQPDRVARWILEEEEMDKVLAPVFLGRERFVWADCLLAQGRGLELLGHMRHTDAYYEERGILYARLQNKILQAIIHHYLGSHAESMEALRAAWALSHGNGLVMLFIEYGSRMRTVAQAALQDGHCTIPQAWLRSIHTKASTYAKRLSQVAKAANTDEPGGGGAAAGLSRRELDVLACLCHGLTREETADACGLSANTVRSIQQSVYGKLGALNGLDAVRIATQRGLV